jgi:hypothetical protein
MVQNETGVEQTLTNVVIREIKNGFLIVPRELKKVVPESEVSRCHRIWIMVITEVEDKIDPGELLEHLSRDPKQGAAKI